MKPTIDKLDSMKLKKDSIKQKKQLGRETAYRVGEKFLLDMHLAIIYNIYKKVKDSMLRNQVIQSINKLVNKMNVECSKVEMQMPKATREMKIYSVLRLYTMLVSVTTIKKINNKFCWGCWKSRCDR